MADTDIKTKAVGATITDTSANADEFPGTFLVELSNETLDRDGETLKGDEWEMPLPEQITFVNDHNHKMKSVVGSAKPELVDGKIICRGTWAETQDAQDTRKVIKHVPYTSVAFREKLDRKSGSVSRELINGSFVVVPSNPTAKVLSSKSVSGSLEDQGNRINAALTEVYGDREYPWVRATFLDDGGASGTVVYQLNGGDTLARGFTDDGTEVTLAGDAREVALTTTVVDVKKSLLPSGLEVVVDETTSTVQIKQHGNLLGEHKFKAPEVAPDMADQSADLQKKAAAQALAAANQIVSRMSEQE